MVNKGLSLSLYYKVTVLFASNHYVTRLFDKERSEECVIISTHLTLLNHDW